MIDNIWFIYGFSIAIKVFIGVILYFYSNNQKSYLFYMAIIGGVLTGLYHMAYTGYFGWNDTPINELERRLDLVHLSLQVTFFLMYIHSLYFMTGYEQTKEEE